MLQIAPMVVWCHTAWRQTAAGGESVGRESDWQSDDIGSNPASSPPILGQFILPHIAQETRQAVGPSYLVQLPREVKYHTEDVNV